MSKVEKALQKARAKEGLQDVAAPVIENQQSISTSTELSPYSDLVQRIPDPWHLSEDDLIKAGIIFPEMEDYRVADAFREIRTKIIQACPSSNCVTLVTSMAEGGGASFVALNLATAFTFDESKSALLIDCNLRRPGFENLLSSEAHYGLTDYLETEGLEESRIIHPIGIPRLRLVPAGRRSETQTEQLSSLKMRDLISKAKQRYIDRYIILDAASISDSADARILAELSDFVLLIAPYGKVTELELWNAAKLIEEKKFLGIVFNNEPQLPKFLWS
jgi:Mrp family chromosome partitioning ATPase